MENTAIQNAHFSVSNVTGAEIIWGPQTTEIRRNAPRHRSQVLLMGSKLFPNIAVN